MSTAHAQRITNDNAESMAAVKNILTVAEVLQLFEGAVGRSTLYKALRLGLLPHKRVGRRIIVSRARLLEWLEGADQPTEGADARRAERG